MANGQGYYPPPMQFPQMNWAPMGDAQEASQGQELAGGIMNLMGGIQNRFRPRRPPPGVRRALDRSESPLDAMAFERMGGL